MADQAEQRFDIYFAGECVPGSDPAAVRAAIAKLFKANEATLERLFSGQRQLVKRGCDQNTALTYQRAMKKAGAKPVIVHAAVEEHAASAIPPATAPASALDLAPVGSDVLRPEERTAPVSSKVRTDHLSASAIGDRISPPAPPVAPVPAPDFGLAETGADLRGGVPPTPAPPAPNTDGLSLAPPEHDLSDCARPPAAVSPGSLDHLQLAETGADMLPEEHRRRDSVAAPDVSHLSVSDPDNQA